MIKNKHIRLTSTALILSLIFAACQVNKKQEEPSLKSALEGKFYIGTAMNHSQILGLDSASLKVIKKQFNSIVAENCMKSEQIHPKENEYYFDLADQFVDFGEANDMYIIGHTLIWHSQAPKWFFVDEEGNEVSREVLIERMKNHIHTVVGRYKGRVKGWDVVNEAILDDGSFRKSKFYNIIGEDFIKLAFQFAHEADPEAELNYNDFSMAKEGKRNGVVVMVKSLQEQGIRIDGVGMQSHIAMKYPDIKEYEKSMQAFSELGVNVMITELDLSVIPSPFENDGADVGNRFKYSQAMDPYKDGMPDSAVVAFNKRYMEFFNLYLKHQENISRVTLWGVNDGNSWRNNWPIPGRTDFPLLFDRNNEAKQIVNEILIAAKNH
ncbi:endo-1,4-beta-xylanase [Plebeiibacterium sediminum]|uniref:Beta-xylanase n=1 Tax=Plebeiibacterium sediminum TaxID=2992112 RepID=A0AAE3M9V0_9BACT|nr:endo-1,4-beta-xylanase [Plebeiobacterium sediminum]MCW3789637.1 endo-1,4-beta-xylanase [Plebeiobacterium sediminum]